MKPPGHGVELRAVSQDDGRGEAGFSPSSLPSARFSLELLNIRGFLTKLPELEGHLRLHSKPPTVLTLNETFLDKSVEEIRISGYKLISRRDRRGDTKGGGIATFVAESAKDTVTLLEHAEEDERSWHILHSDVGPLLLCTWCRPPRDGEVDSVHRFTDELRRLSGSYIGTIVAGDLNLHHTHTG